MHKIINKILVLELFARGKGLKGVSFSDDEIPVESSD